MKTTSPTIIRNKKIVGRNSKSRGLRPARITQTPSPNSKKSTGGETLADQQ